jgi:ribosomal protein L7Ae-like RNA K-turn-binding protein
LIAKSKTATYIGFCVRAGKCRTGTNSICTLKKANLILLCKSASENTKKQVQKIAKKFSAPMLITKDRLLEDLIFKPTVKVMAVTDKALADAIMQNFEEEFICE